MALRRVAQGWLQPVRERGPAAIAHMDERAVVGPQHHTGVDHTNFVARQHPVSRARIDLAAQPLALEFALGHGVQRAPAERAIAAVEALRQGGAHAEQMHQAGRRGGDGPFGRNHVRYSPRGVDKF